MFDLESLVGRAPGWLRRYAQRVATGRGVVGRLADAFRYRYAADEIPESPEVGEAEVRMVIGPANSAGQAHLLARAVEHTVPVAKVLAVRGIGADPFQPPTDLTIPVAVYQRARPWHESFEAFLERQTHLIWESGLPLLGRRWGPEPDAEIAHFRDRGVRCALYFHGSDIRPPSRHAASSRWSPFRDSPGVARILEDQAARNAHLAEQSGLPVFVSTPDLLQWVPGATWCPVIVEPARWRAVSVRRTRSGGPLVVAHAPSRSWIKGTAHIEPILRRLDAEGVI